MVIPAVARVFLTSRYKPLLIALAVGLAGAGFVHWKSGVEAAAHKAGFNQAEAQYTDALVKANEEAAADRSRLDQMVTAFGHISNTREQSITLQLKPNLERIQNEVSTNPVYRDCAVGDRVLDDLQAGRATVDAGIAASNPR